VPIDLCVNGQRHSLAVEPDRRLATVLRDDIGLTGTKVVCGEGACGACAVLLDGLPVNSCLVFAAAAVGCSIVTIEGLSAEGLTPLQEAFVAEDALQCGFCTAGQIVTASALLAANPHASRAQIREAMAGNLCRCGTYPKIERALLRLTGE
jgi:aerobic-type carbon monoxide dehydrogenase small subunit (CoxS/CutS family)